MKSFGQIRGQKLKIFFLDVTMTSSCLSWSLCTHELLSNPFLMCRNVANSFFENHEILIFFKKPKIYENVLQKSL